MAIHLLVATVIPTRTNVIFVANIKVAARTSVIIWSQNCTRDNYNQGVIFGFLWTRDDIN